MLDGSNEALVTHFSAVVLPVNHSQGVHFIIYFYLIKLQLWKPPPTQVISFFFASHFNYMGLIQTSITLKTSRFMKNVTLDIMCSVWKNWAPWLQ